MRSDKNENWCVISLEDNELTIYKIQDSLEFINREIGDCENIELNLRDISEFDTSGIQLLISLKNYTKRTDKMLNISSLSSSVEELLTLYNLKSYFEYKG